MRVDRLTGVDALLDLLDTLFDDREDATSRAATEHWDTMYTRPGHPLAVDLPDANLVAWRDAGLLPLDTIATALDVGCGLGRNSRWLAAQGVRTTGVDIAATTLDRARTLSAGLDVTFADVDVLREPVLGGPFDLVYDSGCFHHLAPHRRISYLRTLRSALRPGGWFGICTFTAGRMGSSADDADLLRSGRVGEGVGYTEAELVDVFSWLEPVAIGPIPPQADVAEPVFTHDFLTVALFRRPG
jgi:SAM-dependent methyltransferase